jgi:cell division septum initiation protein DivIVA
MEILGLLDTLESMILDGTKIPFAKRVVINEEKVLAVIDKMRLVIQGGGGFAKGAIASQGAEEEGGKDVRRETGRKMPRLENREMIEGRSEDEAKAVEVLQQAYEMAREIREGADKYADEILANLEATSTRILRTVKAGRDRLTKEAVASGESK